MMVKATYKRVIQLRPFESQTIELSIEEECNNPARKLDAVKTLYQQLEEIGDALTIDILGEDESEGSSPARPAY